MRSVKHLLSNLSKDSAPEMFHSEMEMFQTTIGGTTHTSILPDDHRKQDVVSIMFWWG